MSPKAELAPGAKVGPFCTVGDYVSIGKDTELISHVHIEGHTLIGSRNKIYPFTSIGTPPQDVGYGGEDTRVIIGDDNLIKEYTTINRATTKEEWKTVVGNNNYFMAYSHVAHDCVLGNWIIMSNVATLAGHTSIGDYATVGALCAVQQFTRIGAYAFIGAKTGIDRDPPPFMIVAGRKANLYGVNQRGLRRLGFSQEKIDGLKRAYKIIWRENKNFKNGVEQVRRKIETFPELEILLTFFDGSKRGILR